MHGHAAFGRDRPGFAVELPQKGRHGFVPSQYLGAELRDAALAGGSSQRTQKQPPETTALHAVDHGDGSLRGLRLSGEAHEACAPERVAELGSDGCRLRADRDTVPAVQVQEIPEESVR